ncbi:unnamed protein product [Allacma fusca]|uniref:Uncharacterized protein n=1 Tax=Allacma fusca TaxID=39272 RepID=A0A8J2L103_9HEXA|nr:unnamed protein product [Allacma fusca]
MKLQRHTSSQRVHFETEPHSRKFNFPSEWANVCCACHTSKTNSPPSLVLPSQLNQAQDGNRFYESITQKALEMAIWFLTHEMRIAEVTLMLQRQGANWN